MRWCFCFVILLFFKGLDRETGRVDLRAAGLTGGAVDYADGRHVRFCWSRKSVSVNAAERLEVDVNTLRDAQKWLATTHSVWFRSTTASIHLSITPRWCGYHGRALFSATCCVRLVDSS